MIVLKHKNTKITKKNEIIKLVTDFEKKLFEALESLNNEYSHKKRFQKLS